jgi:hypothetical protein
MVAQRLIQMNELKESMHILMLVMRVRFLSSCVCLHPEDHALRNVEDNDEAI